MQDVQPAAMPDHHRQALGARFLGQLLAAGVEIERLLQDPGELGVGGQDTVEQMGRAGQPRPAARFGLAAAQQHEQIAAVGVEIQLVIGLETTQIGVGLEIAAGVADMMQKIARGILGKRHAGVLAEAPQGTAGLIGVIAVNRHPAQHRHTAAGVDLVAERGQARPQGWQAGVSAGDLGHRQGGAGRHRVIQFGDFRRA